MESKKATGESLTPGEAERYRRLLHTVGPRRAEQLTGIPENTLARLAAEMVVRRATAIVARQVIGRLKIEDLEQ